MKLFTIGHSNYSIEEFSSLLNKYQITAVADVRSHPYSRYLPHFNQKYLQNYLKTIDIAYVFLGKELGARSDNSNCYVNGKALYKLIANTEEFKQGLKRITKGVKHYNIALMCAEQDPITCHRAILVSRHLQKQGFTIQHILKNGNLENHTELEQRLLKLHNLLPNSQPFIQLSLFETNFFVDNIEQNNNNNNNLSEEEMLDQAYEIQGDKIAYVDKKRENEDDNNY